MTYQKVSFILFFLIITSCTQGKGVKYIQIEVFNPDSTASFEYSVYSLGPPSGYITIEIDGEEILRYDELAVIYGGWADNQTIELLSSDLPIKKNTHKTEMKVLVEKADGYNDYRREPYLIHLSK